MAHLSWQIWTAWHDTWPLPSLYLHNIINYSPKYITTQKTLHLTYNKSRATSLITRFAAYLGRNVSKIASRGSFSCHRHTSGRSDMHAKYLFGILCSPKYITKDSIGIQQKYNYKWFKCSITRFDTYLGRNISKNYLPHVIFMSSPHL